MCAGLFHLRLTLDSQGLWVREAAGGRGSGWDTLSSDIRRRVGWGGEATEWEEMLQAAGPSKRSGARAWAPQWLGRGGRGGRGLQ